MPHSAAETLARHRHQDAMAAASSQQKILSPTCRVSKVGGRSADGYGAWFMCTEGLGPNSGVLSVGIGGDISFDLALVRRFGASVRCFDPTISEADFDHLLGNASATAEERARVRFYPFGLAARNSVIPFYRSTNPIVHSLVSEPGLRGYAPAAYARADAAIAAAALGRRARAGRRAEGRHRGRRVERLQPDRRRDAALARDVAGLAAHARVPRPIWRRRRAAARRELPGLVWLHEAAREAERGHAVREDEGADERVLV